ncbi:MAG: (2Fe-2S)-binding protein [Bdellovibrionaceae bacterium]|nr:(2Fe-2S)-binding protein [Pseudobdellovibrionaceae bacterium]
MSVSIKFLIEHQAISVEIQRGETILDAAVRRGIPLSHSCGGFGTCGTCRVLVVEGLELLGERSELESEMAADRGFVPNERLACQVSPGSDLVVRVPEDFKEKS